MKQKKYKWGEKPPAELQQEKKKYGICSKCDNGGFTLRVIGGELERTCKKCEEVKGV